MAGIYDQFDDATVKSIVKQNEEKRSLSFFSRVKKAREDRKEEHAKAKEVEAVIQNEILESTKALKTCNPSAPGYKTACDSIEKLGKTLEYVDNKDTVNKKLLIPIVGAAAVTGLAYGFEKIGRTQLTGGLKTIGQKALGIPTSLIGKFRN